MKKSIIKVKILLSIVTILLCLNALPVFAANSGDAVYRSGVYGYHHTGILKYDTDGSSKVYETRGIGCHVTYDSWNQFLNYPAENNTYLGAFYNPSYQPASSILYTAAALTSYPAIQYSSLGQMTYDSTAGTYIYVNHITALRCDGVVEYCYEWNNSRIWGCGSNRDTNWDISAKANVSAHYCLGIDPSITVSPYVQHTGYPYYSTLVAR